MLRSRSKRYLAYLLVIVLILLGSSVAIAPAAEGPPGQPIREAPQGYPSSNTGTYKVKGFNEIWTMWDGETHLPVSVFAPDAGESDELFPVIIFVHGWDCDKLLFEEMAKYYAGKGYIGVTYTVRGWYGAECQITCIDPEHEMKDLSHIITRVSGDERFPVLEDEKGPVVGVVGYSMGGIHSLLIAPRRDQRVGDPGDERVRVIVPMHGGADLVYTLYPNGAVKFFWGTGLMMGAYMANFVGLMMNAVDIIFDYDLVWWEKALRLVNEIWKVDPLLNDVSPEMNRIYQIGIQRKIEEAEYAKQFLKQRSARYWCDEEYDGVVEHPIEIPMLILMGWKDDIFFPNEGLQLFSSCTEAPRRFIITNHGHIGGFPGDLFVDTPENPEAEWICGEVERWLDRYLKGIDNGVEDDPRLVFYRDRDPENYGEADDFPIPGTCDTSYYLGGKRSGREGKLTTRKPWSWFGWPDFLLNIGITGSISLPYFNDVTAYLGMDPLPIPQRIDMVDIPFTMYSYTTDPLSEDVTVMGAPLVELHYQSSKPFTQLTPWLYEVTPEGEEILISRG